MTSKYRGALDNRNSRTFLCDYGDVVTTALLIAERLESGEWSPQIYEQIYKANIKADDIDLQAHGEVVFKAMAKVMIEEAL